MNALLDEIYRTGAVADGAGNRIDPFPSSVPLGLGHALYELVRREGLERTLEVGLSNGLSCLAICQAHQERGRGQHVAIDPHQATRFRSVGLLNVKRAGLDRFLRFFEAPSYEVLPRLLADRETIDLAFIDGRHLFDYVLVDFFYLDQFLPAGGYLMFDDLNMPAVRKVVSFALTNRAYVRVPLDTNRGIPFWKQAARVAHGIWRQPLDWSAPALRFSPQRACLLRKTSASDDRPWDFHRPF